MSIRALIAVVGLCLSAAQAQAEPTASFDPNRVTEVNYGIFCERPPAKASADQDTIKGSVERYSTNPALWSETQTIPAVDGLLFGVLGREDPDSGFPVTIVVDHPPLGPSGTTTESWDTEMHGDHVTFHGYYLGLGDGNPVGRWTITALRGGRELFAVEFDVVKATRADRKAYANCATRIVS